ncbi:MAG: acylphosphatase [Fidelibacterota bacterium]|nr:MAG: acylphosphatase [Candidatus Neomarinimicrobiota bacterium]
MRKVRITVAGRVQGVGFRWSARRQAIHYKINGYVRNLPSGEVEMVAEGDDAGVAQMIHWARQGPSWSHVADLRIEELPYDNEYHDFNVRI